MTLYKIPIKALNLIPLFLFILLFLWIFYKDISFTSLPVYAHLLFIAIFVLGEFISLKVNKILILTGQLFRFGEYNEINRFVLIIRLLFALGIILLTLLDYNSNHGIHILLSVGIMTLIQGFTNIKKYYVRIDKKCFEKYDFQPIRIKDITEIEFLEDKVIVGSEERNLKLFYDNLNEDEKEQFCEVLKRIQKNKSIEVI